MSESSEAPTRRKNNRSRPRRVPRAIHKWLGLIIALPLLWMAVSGYLLNHAEGFGLHKYEVKAKWVLNHYHQLPSGTPLGAVVGDRRISEWDEMIFLDERLLDIPGELVGAAVLNDQLLIVTRERVAVLNGTGEMVMELDELTLPGTPIVQAAMHEGKFHLKSEDARWWQLEDNLIDSRQVFEAPEVLLKTSPLPKESIKRLEVALQNRGFIPFSRVLLDAHSGKLFGKFGVFLNDLVVLSIIILTLLGLRLFPKRKPDGGGRKRMAIDQAELKNPVAESRE